MKRSVLFVSMFVIAILLVGCGPWNYNAACVSKVGDSTGCVDAGAPANAWLQMNGYNTPVINVNVNVPTQQAPVVNVTVPTQQPPVVNINVPTAAPMPTVAQTTAPIQPAPQSTPVVQATDPKAAHYAHLKQLDPVYRSQGLEAWLKAAGITWSESLPDARQVEEQTSPDSQVLIAGVQLKVNNMTVNYPACVTTDTPSRVTTNASTRQYQPDLRNGTTLYTNVVANGPITVYADCSDWGQLSSR